jgi:hypothetical protein
MVWDPWNTKGKMATLPSSISPTTSQWSCHKLARVPYGCTHPFVWQDCRQHRILVLGKTLRCSSRFQSSSTDRWKEDCQGGCVEHPCPPWDWSATWAVALGCWVVFLECMETFLIVTAGGC